MTVSTTYHDFYVVSGVLFGLAITSAIIRTVVRLKRFGAVFSDDWVLFVGLATMIAGTVICWIDLPLVQTIGRVGGGVEVPPPDFQLIKKTDQRYWAVEIVLLVITICAVKYSFLLFFHRIIGRTRRRYIIWWWFVFVTTTISLLSVIILVLASCPNDSKAKPKCRVVQSPSLLFGITLFDILTDVLIISIPVFFLWNTRISMRRKFGFAGVLCLSVFMIACSAIRLVPASAINDTRANVLWIKLWIDVEGSVSVICVSASAFPVLFLSGSDDARPKPPGSETRRNFYEARRRRRIAAQDSTILSFMSRVLGQNGVSAGSRRTDGNTENESV